MAVQGATIGVARPSPPEGSFAAPPGAAAGSRPDTHRRPPTRTVTLWSAAFVGLRPMRSIDLDQGQVKLSLSKLTVISPFAFRAKCATSWPTTLAPSGA